MYANSINAYGDDIDSYDSLHDSYDAPYDSYGNIGGCGACGGYDSYNIVPHNDYVSVVDGPSKVHDIDYDDHNDGDYKDYLASYRAFEPPADGIHKESRL